MTPNPQPRPIRGVVSPYFAPGLPVRPEVVAMRREQYEQLGTQRTFQLYQEVVSRRIGRDPADLKLKRRWRPLVQGRQLVMSLANTLLELSLDQVGKDMGYFDHATVLHSKRTVSNLYATNRQYREMVVNPILEELCISERQMERMELKVIR